MNDFKITPIEQDGQRVLTTAQLAEAYGTTSKVISNNFNRNIDRYIESVHFYRLTGEEKREFCNRHQIEDGLKATDFYLWTEKGALLHAKSLNTDKAWEVYEFLVDTYFRIQEINNFYDVDIDRRLETLEHKIDYIYKEIKLSDKKTENIIVKSVSETAKSLVPYFDTLMKVIQNLLKLK
ncbi:MAG: ORF6N domain-containing protein [Ruminococcus sp.]|nr:ORF6N domain-containing protein [Ruminococcus sp.]